MASDFELILNRECAFPKTFPLNDRIGFAVMALDDGVRCRLFPEEEAILTQYAVDRRKKQFALGRAAAHSAIAMLPGRTAEPVLMGKGGEPLWPEGLVGAITHSGHTAVSAVGRKEDANGIGVDLERLSRKVPREVLLEVCTAPELAWVKGGKNSEDIHLRLRMLFSAKEAGFKAFFPVERVFLWFRDAELDWIARESCFSGRLLKSAGRDYPAGYRYSVGCMITQEFVFTYTMLPPSSSEEKHGGQA